MRMSGIPFLIDLKTPIMKSPTGKIPWILCKGKTICDSSKIIAFLKEEFPDKVIPDGPKSRLIPIQRLVEDHTYWIQTLYRWGRRDSDFDQLMKIVMKGVPSVMQVFIRRMVRGKVRQQLYSQGVGRMPMNLVIQKASEDLDALEELLGDSVYFGGENPEQTDAIVYGLLTEILYGLPDREYPLRTHLKRKTNLVKFVNRIRDKWFSHGERVPKHELYRP